MKRFFLRILTLMIIFTSFIIVPACGVDKNKVNNESDIIEKNESQELLEGFEDKSSVVSSKQLKVVDGELMDASNNPIQLKGISTHGLAWFPQYINKDCFATFQSAGANVIRLAMYTGESGGYCSGGNQAELIAIVEKGVDYATELGMYVIIDWHILSDNNPQNNQQAAIDFFGKMSAKYKDYDNVIYEICNEPNGGTSWAQVKEYANAVIPVIRENTDAVILVGTPQWCQQLDPVIADPITGYDNIMYTLHFYAATHKDDLRSQLVRAKEAKLPVFVSEYGICDASGNGNIDIDSANKWVELMDEYNVSYVCWNLANKNEASSVLNPSCQKVSGFTEEDYSQEGKWLIEVLGK
ncbi:MAG: glycoside hydrolase family 5 protein [Lachnospiraceae bacterium]|nr:glycoside hydrolase family 5 protein [Lachnospiraceae bacterium]